MASDQQIAEYWTSPNFPGSYSGLISFRQELKAIDIDVPIKRLKRILSNIPDYLKHSNRVKRFPRRSYFVHGYLELVQVISIRRHSLKKL